MFRERRYTLSELAEYLTERTDKNEFKPRKGEKVDSENAKNNKKAVNDIMKDTEKHSGVSVPKRNHGEDNVGDLNLTTLDYRFDTKPDERYRERVRAQAMGYPSPENEKNTDVKDSGASFEGNKALYKRLAKRAKTREEDRESDKKAGLKGRVLAKNDSTIFKSNTLYNENKTMKRLHFKNTCFLSEAQMFSRIPEEYKTDGNRFIMRDATGTDYLVECRVDDTFGNKMLSVINKMNKQSVNEELARMKELYGYKSSDRFEGRQGKTDMSALLEEMRQASQK